MRYYWQNDGRKCTVSVTDVDREYSSEYQGCTSRRVIPPLALRYFLTLSQAVELWMGSARAGPADTRKGAPVQDLAKVLGIVCVVFNCSDQTNYRALGRFFGGLAPAGVWGSFDEFE
jgi:dynein heavy chain